MRVFAYRRYSLLGRALRGWQKAFREREKGRQCELILGADSTLPSLLRVHRLRLHLQLWRNLYKRLKMKKNEEDLVYRRKGRMLHHLWEKWRLARNLFLADQFRMIRLQKHIFDLWYHYARMQRAIQFCLERCLKPIFVHWRTVAKTQRRLGRISHMLVLQRWALKMLGIAARNSRRQRLCEVILDDHSVRRTVQVAARLLLQWQLGAKQMRSAREAYIEHRCVRIKHLYLRRWMIVRRSRRAQWQLSRNCLRVAFKRWKSCTIADILDREKLIIAREYYRLSPCRHLLLRRVWKSWEALRGAQKFDRKVRLQVHFRRWKQYYAKCNLQQWQAFRWNAIHTCRRSLFTWRQCLQCHQRQSRSCAWYEMRMQRNSLSQWIKAYKRSKHCRTVASRLLTWEENQQRKVLRQALHQWIRHVEDSLELKAQHWEAAEFCRRQRLHRAFAWWRGQIFGFHCNS